jgi:hypothetical protein
MNRKIDRETGKGEDDMLVNVARTIGAALGTVAAKISPAREVIRTGVRKAKTSKVALIAKSAVGGRAAPRSRSRTGARRSKAKR